MKTLGWLATLVSVSCTCDVQVPSSCEEAGGACQPGGLSCPGIVLAGLCGDAAVCCVEPGTGGGGGGRGGGGGGRGGGGGGRGGGGGGGSGGGGLNPGSGGGDEARPQCAVALGHCAPYGSCPTMQLTGYECGGDTICCANVDCDAGTVTAYVDSRKSCTTASDCTPLCQLGSTCDLRAVNASGVAGFSTTFFGCDFPQCAIDCGLADCVDGHCTP